MNTKQNIIQDLFIEYGILNSDLTVNKSKKGSKIESILTNAKKGLKQYLSIQRCLHLTNPSKDILFQEMFSNFYGIRFKDISWKKEYFTLLEISKEQKKDFGEILKILYTKTNTVDASFSSKLLATINPNLPVIDKWIRINLSINEEYQEISALEDISDRLKKTENFYNKLVDIFEEFIPTEGAKNIFDYFNLKYPYTNITETSKITKVKILDLILWQLRD
ncbi:MAG: hypothetical protein WC011_00920 [Candidatus Paceibacterota bacterium]